MFAADLKKVFQPSVPSVVVVDPRFDAYRPLSASARLGKIDLHLRSSGAEAVKLARRMRVDAWLIAPDLEDMSGHDLITLLREELNLGGGRVAMVESTRSGRQRAEQEGCGEAAFCHPITFHDLETLLGLPTAERARLVGGSGSTQGLVALPVGVGAAVIAIAVLLLG